MTLQQPDSNAEASLAICSLFESELLLRLMLHHWGHPRADDVEFQGQLLETATEVLEAAVATPHHVFVDGVPTSEMNFVVAVWYAERVSLDEGRQSLPPKEMEARRRWFESIRRALPSCFCDPDDLMQP